MGWQDRSYSSDSDPGYGHRGGGLRSWIGGLPPVGRVVKFIMLANLAVFLLCQFTGGSRGGPYRWLSMQTELAMSGQIWRIFTFTYMHSQSDLWHIALNMLGLYFLGTPLERQWGPRRFFAFYTLGGLAAGMLYLLLTVAGVLNPQAILVGASGNVFAVLGACAVLFPQFRLIFVFFPVPIRTAALIFVVLFSFNLIKQGANAGGDACHLAGLAFGIYWGYRGHGWLEKWGRWQEKTRRGAWEAKRQEQLQTEEKVDQILEKIKTDGINSLSRREKQLLELATRQKKTRDRRYGF